MGFPNTARSPSDLGDDLIFDPLCSGRTFKKKLTEIEEVRNPLPFTVGGLVARAKAVSAVRSGASGKIEATSGIRDFCDPLPGSNSSISSFPRVFVATAPRPGATIRDPYRDQEANCEDSNKASYPWARKKHGAADSDPPRPMGSQWGVACPQFIVISWA